MKGSLFLLLLDTALSALLVGSMSSVALPSPDGALLRRMVLSHKSNKKGERPDPPKLPKVMPNLGLSNLVKDKSNNRWLMEQRREEKQRADRTKLDLGEQEKYDARVMREKKIQERQDQFRRQIAKEHGKDPKYLQQTLSRTQDNPFTLVDHQKKGTSAKTFESPLKIQRERIVNMPKDLDALDNSGTKKLKQGSSKS